MRSMPSFPKPSFPFSYQVNAEVDALRDYRDTKPGRQIPAKSQNRLLLASWNIANLGLQKRRDQDYQIIAEMISWFDLVALQEVNDNLPIRFSMMPSEHGFLFGGLVSQKTQNVYTGDAVGVVARIANPWNRDRRVIVLAGNKAVGTKACVLALAKFWKQTLKNFRAENDFATVIQGFDLDGDGKVDSVEVLE